MRREAGGIVSALRALLVVGVVLALLAAVAYLLADINHRRYRLAVRQGQLQVERGLFLPVGFGPYEPETATLREVYAPLPVPTSETLNPQGNYDERADVDRALFTLLSGWARQRLDATDSATLELASMYVKRLEGLPSISEEQRGELRLLRANLAFREGGRILLEVQERLRRAQESFHQAILLGSPHATEAQQWMTEIDRRLALSHDVPPAANPGHAPTQ